MCRRRDGRSLFVLVFPQMVANLIFDVMLNGVANLLSDVRFYMLSNERINVTSHARQTQLTMQDEPQFKLDSRAPPGHKEHSEPRTPKGDGLGEHLDVTA